MHVLVTGGAGFIGSHLVDLHLARGHKVHVVDDLSTGDPANVERHADNPLFKFDHADLLTFDRIHEVSAWADRIYHLAAVVGVFRVLQDPTAVLASNIAACERLLRAVAVANWKPEVVIASSSEVYGHRNDDNLCETDELIITSGLNPRWSYSTSKIADEALGVAFAHKYGIPITLIRLFNTVGPRQRGKYGMVVPRFVRQAVAGEPVTVFGDGQQSRSFCDVRDTVHFLDQLASRSHEGIEVVNVGNDREISILDLAKLVIERSGSDSKIDFIDYKTAYGEPYEDIRRRHPNLGLLKSLVGHRHGYALEDTIDDLVAAAREKQGEMNHGDNAILRSQSGYGT
ncbi:MAG: NAD-dependent epimerase/dehydratase family protein [Wenzhouxiangella sp.]